MYINIKKIFLLALLFSLFSTSLTANQQLQTITLQLQWKHQFEFAGFYAAKEKGFYKDVGLDVQFKDFDPEKDIISEVLHGHADYGLVYSSLIARYIKGDPLIFVANFFKYSPLMIVSQEQYTLPSDLKNKTVMGVSNELSAETIMMMFKKFDMTTDDLKIVTPTFKLEDFIDKKVDAMSVYATNEVYALTQSKVKFNVLNPSAYGIPSYDLNLFTTQQELKNNPKRLSDFRAASIKGWKYALENTEEIIQLILKKYNTQNKSYEALKFEANQIHNIMLPSLMEIGSIDPQKVKLIAENFMELNLAPKKEFMNFDAFIYNVPPKNLNLTQSEKYYLQNKHEIIYCSDPVWLPYSNVKDGEHSGIDADIIKILSEKLKRNFVLNPTRTWQETLEKGKKGKCDVITSMVSTPSRQKYFSFTQPLIQSPLVLATTVDKRFTDDVRELVSEPIGIVKDYAHKELLSFKYPNLQIVEVENLEEGLKKIAKKELYGFIDDLSVLSYAIEKNHLGAMKISAKIDINLQLSYAVKKEDKTLLSIMNKAIDSIEEGDKRESIKKWTSVSVSDAKYYYETLAKTLFFLILIILALLYHYRKVRKDNKQLEYISNIDILSNLYNRRYMDTLIQNNYKNKHHESFALILVDIDSFKNINDSYGHPVGDDVIQKVSYILKNNIPSDYVASRWGGEEFLIYCPYADAKKATHLAEELRQQIQVVLKDENGLDVTCSFGVAEYTFSNFLQSTYLHKVDQALYKAKRAGKNQVAHL